MKTLLVTAVLGLAMGSEAAYSATWNGRWRNRTDPPSNVDVVLRISGGKPAWFTWNGAGVGVKNVYIERSGQHYRFSTNGGADITLTPNGPGSIRLKYWHYYLGTAEGVLHRAECRNVGPGRRCLDP